MDLVRLDASVVSHGSRQYTKLVPPHRLHAAVYPANSVVPATSENATLADTLFTVHDAQVVALVPLLRGVSAPV